MGKSLSKSTVFCCASSAITPAPLAAVLKQHNQIRYVNAYIHGCVPVCSSLGYSICIHMSILPVDFGRVMSLSCVLFHSYLPQGDAGQSVSERSTSHSPLPRASFMRPPVRGVVCGAW